MLKLYKQVWIREVNKLSTTDTQSYLVNLHTLVYWYTSRVFTVKQPNATLLAKLHNLNFLNQTEFLFALNVMTWQSPIVQLKISWHGSRSWHALSRPSLIDFVISAKSLRRNPGAKLASRQWLFSLRRGFYSLPLHRYHYLYDRC